MIKPQVSDSKVQSNHRLAVIFPKREWILIGLILCQATMFRLYRLDSVPPGLTHDEANNAHDAASVMQGARPFYFPVAQGKEPLYPYSVALTMAIIGPTPLAMRLTSAFWGILVVVLTYAWTRRAFGHSTALWTAAGLALSFWGVSTSRMGLRAIMLPALFTAALLVSRLAETKPPSRAGSMVAGSLLGLTFYTYLAARVMLAVPLLFGLYLFSIKRDRWRQCWPSWIGMLVVTTVVAAPLFLYLRTHPAAEIRVGQLDQPLRDLMSGNPGPLMKNVFQTLAGLSFRGDGFVPYNIPGRPILDPLMSLLFYVGLTIALWRWRDPAHALALLWLAVGSFPALATGVEAANLRAIGAQPVLFLFPALTLERLRSVRTPRLRILNRVSYLVGVLALTLVACLTVRDYFIRWANDRDVRIHYHTDLMTLCDTLQEWKQDEPVVISTFYPGEYHDPRILEAVLEKNAPPVYWLDGRQAVLLPLAPTARLVLPAVIPLDETLWAFVEPDAALREQVTLRPDDFNPNFKIYHWSVDDTLSTLHATMSAPSQPSRLPVWMGQWLTFQGYQLAGWTGKPGSEFDLLTLWRVEARLPDDRDAVLFAQLLGSQNQVVVQRDQLGAPSWGWQPGDAILQLYRLSLPADAAPGQHTLIAGVYTVPDRVDAVLAGHEPDPSMPRLPVLADGAAVGDHILLQSIEVVTQ
jgi:4-amino-4-deoxy-L-arabinose transferase-like glycosyltransferase